jgi:hypothetical protein
MSLSPPSEHPLIQAAIAETETLHAFFESWLGADPPTPESFARVEAALAPTFTLIGPDGRRESRDAVIAALQAEHGARGPDFRIRVEAPEPVALEPPVVVLAYRERQWLAGVETLRQSTAVFRSDGEAPNGLRWLTLQETWMKG